MNPVITLTSGPSSEPISVADVKTHSRIFISADDTYIGELITAARDKWERDTGYYLTDQSYEATYKHYHRHIMLPMRPVSAVASVNALVLTTDYTVDIDIRTGQALIKLITPVIGNVVIDYSVGPGMADSPMLARHAVKTLVAHWYEYREAYQPGSSFKTVPATYQSIVSTFRMA